jgi:pimeloyl-ACP methyl ester carboxylesterase
MSVHVNPPADRWLTLPGAALRYRDEGRGPVVLLVHGWTLDLEMWAPQVPALRDKFRLVRFDRRGFGLSAGRPGLAHDVADIEALCRHLALERLALVGMSQGARAVLGFAASSPERISGLILDGSPDCLQDGSTAADDPPMEHYRTLLQQQGIDAVRRQWATHPLARLRTGDRRQRALLAAMIARYPANDLLDSRLDNAVLAGTDVESIRAPVLVITGEYDVASRIAAADALSRRIPDAQRAVIPDAGHVANLDNPQRYNAVVRAFLERHAAQAA